ncbi:MAG: hypothetical protein K2H01_12750 [Ruminococcus sp.]|nr:hypothetical protein [Ruminococcus sp.]
MSKTLDMKIFTGEDFQCNLKNIVGLLEKAGWSIIDGDGRINVWNEADSEWEIYNGTLDDFFLNTTYDRFFAYNGLKIIIVYTIGCDSFGIIPDAYIQKTIHDDREYFDYNWYYLHFIPAFNKGKVVVERVIFDEY